jgi:hypothetical protein
MSMMTALFFQSGLRRSAAAKHSADVAFAVAFL